MASMLPSASLLLLLLLPLLNAYADQVAAMRRSLLQGCVDWSDNAASAIAEAACLRANGDCPRPTLGSQSGENNPANPLDRLGGKCLSTNKDQCLMESRGYISGGYGMCVPALSGVGSCSDDDFNLLAEKYLRQLCTQAGNAEQLTLP
ncbi:hypothetical protein Vafri_22246 [Volvox africanus]|uniref:Uncharacterized protein n=1 Tax=Volvox africanus TaxID=51714 RepID=A0A8J4C098_9CHLO|nr:hypothetical protein Vafri_22246 [Volvox africanus]